MTKKEEPAWVTQFNENAKTLDLIISNVRTIQALNAERDKYICELQSMLHAKDKEIQDLKEQINNLHKSISRI